jgi:hypothetical protein
VAESNGNGNGSWSTFSKAFTTVATGVITAALIGGAALLLNIRDAVTSLSKDVSANTKATEANAKAIGRIERGMNYYVPPRQRPQGD